MLLQLIVVAIHYEPYLSGTNLVYEAEIGTWPRPTRLVEQILNQSAPARWVRVRHYHGDYHDRVLWAVTVGVAPSGGDRHWHTASVRGVGVHREEVLQELFMLRMLVDYVHRYYGRVRRAALACACRSVALGGCCAETTGGAFEARSLGA